MRDEGCEIKEAFKRKSKREERASQWLNLSVTNEKKCRVGKICYHIMYLERMSLQNSERTQLVSVTKLLKEDVSME